MRNTGVIGEYSWLEVRRDSIGIPRVVQAVADALRGHIALNVSWDSGVMPLSEAQEGAGWSRRGTHAVSPPIDHALAANWPTSTCQSGRFDEWYFFTSLPALASIRPFCNYAGVSLSDWDELAFPGALDLLGQLSTLRPDMVIGMGEATFVISRDAVLLEHLWSEVQDA